jgi:predicted RNA-binding Zn-ribbon protein involved in translation (DUF1610 family)
MAERVQWYRLNAEKCLELVGSCRDPEAKRALLVMANAWLMLAAQRAKNIEAMQASEAAPHRVRGREMSDPNRSLFCPRCQSPMVYLTDNRRIVEHSYQCEKCGFISQSDEPDIQAFKLTKS